MDALYKLAKIKPEEIVGALVAFLFIFILMASYGIAKPVRDAMASDFSDPEIAKLWTYTFIVSTISVFFYNILSANISLKKLVPGVFIFFALTFIATAICLWVNVDRVLVGKFFYIWISVFALFHVSVFWSFASQNYTKEQSKRIFTFINTGASVGAITGPLIGLFFITDVPLEIILMITSGTLIAVLPLIAIMNRYFSESKVSQNDNQPTRLSANPFTGISEFFSNKRLVSIGLFIFIFVGISSFFYLAQKDILSEYLESERRAILNKLDIYINILTILLGIFATNRIASKFGLSTALSIVPVIVVGSLVVFATSPTVAVFLVLQLIRKAGNYSITRPSREILFTAVDREARFKTKPFIDVAIYRGGDVFWAWFFVMLGDGFFNLDLPGKLLVGAAIAGLWSILAFYIGRRYEIDEKKERETQAASI